MPLKPTINLFLSKFYILWGGGYLWSLHQKFLFWKKYLSNILLFSISKTLQFGCWTVAQIKFCFERWVSSYYKNDTPWKPLFCPKCFIIIKSFSVRVPLLKMWFSHPLAPKIQKHKKYVAVLVQIFTRHNPHVSFNPCHEHQTHPVFHVKSAHSCLQGKCYKTEVS